MCDTIIQKNRLKLLGRLIFGLLPGMAVTPVWAIQVQENSNAEFLVSELLGSGIKVYNVDYDGDNRSVGTFTQGEASGIGIDSGVVLTTGLAIDAQRELEEDKASTNMGNSDYFQTDGDADLTDLVNTTSDEFVHTYDGTALEFDFETESGNLYFNYVFASEERGFV